MTVQKEKKINLGLKLIFSFTILIIFVLIGSLKSGMHIDEMYTYGLANKVYPEGDLQILAPIENNKAYQGEDLLTDYTAVQKGHAFDYKNVIVNQSKDVHPPLYYLAIHTISSFFIGEFSLWFGLAFNLLLAVVVFWQIVAMLEHLIANKIYSIVFSFLFIFTAGFVNNVMFLRMYLLLTVFTNALVLLVFKYGPSKRKDYKFYLTLSAIFFFGIMTQYYFLIYFVFCSFIYGIYLIGKKRFREVILCVESVLLAAGLAVLLYPAMIWHIFFGYRGKESLDNIGEKGFFANFRIFWGFLNKEIFGGILVIIILLMIAIAIFASISRKQRYKIRYEYIVLGFSILGYIGIVAQVSTLKRDRYIMNIMGISFVFIIAILYHLVTLYQKKLGRYVVVLVALVVLLSYKNGIEFLYLNDTGHQEALKKKQSVPCLYFYEGNIMYAMTDFYEMRYLDSVTFIPIDNVKNIKDNFASDKEAYWVYVATKNNKEVIKQIKEAKLGFSQGKEIFQNTFSNTYYFEKDKVEKEAVLQ